MNCPKCNSKNIRFEYGGERGEAGPFIYCIECNYDEEDDLKKQKREKNMVLVKFKVLEHGKGLPPPSYASNGAAGIDLYAADEPEGGYISPGERCLLPTGISIQLPKGFEAQIRPRSGLAYTYGATVLNSPGTVDADFRGEIRVIIINHGPVNFSIKRGDRIAQLIVMPVPTITLKEVKELDQTERGEGGFGSTG